MANLLFIPQYFELEIYTTSRQEKVRSSCHLCFVKSLIIIVGLFFSFPQNLETLLRLMQDVVERHSETEVLENCSKTLEILCTEEHAIYSRCDVIRSTLIDRLVSKLREVLDEHATLLAGVISGK